jgi:tetratricopeptide (TPR) repeat protein
MIKAFLFLIISVCLVFQIGCSQNGSSGGDASNANSDQTATQQFPDAETALAEGNRLLDANETEQAIEAFKQASAMNPELGEPYFKLGIAYSLIESEKKGSLTTQPEPPGSETKKEGQTKPASQKAFEHAVEAYKNWLAKNPGDDAAQFNLGRAHNKLNKDEDAEKALRQAVKLKPDDTEYQTEFGAILVKLAKYHEAIDPLKKAIDLDPDNSRAVELLDDAEAGRTRVDYVPPKKDSGKSSNSNANVDDEADSNSASNSKPPADDNKPKNHEKPDTKEKKTPPPANKTGKPGA